MTSTGASSGQGSTVGGGVGSSGHGSVSTGSICTAVGAGVVGTVWLVELAVGAVWLVTIVV